MSLAPSSSIMLSMVFCDVLGLGDLLLLDDLDARHLLDRRGAFGVGLVVAVVVVRADVDEADHRVLGEGRPRRKSSRNGQCGASLQNAPT